MFLFQANAMFLYTMRTRGRACRKYCSKTSCTSTCTTTCIYIYLQVCCTEWSHGFRVYTAMLHPGHVCQGKWWTLYVSYHCTCVAGAFCKTKVYMYVRTYKYMYMYIKLWTYMYVYMYMDSYTCTCVLIVVCAVYEFSCTCTCTFIPDRQVSIYM